MPPCQEHPMLHLLSRFRRPAETTASRAGAAVALYVAGRPVWTPRDYAALAREGYMRNPVVHRSVRLIAEAAAAVPWLIYRGAAALADHPALGLLAAPNPQQAGGSFREALFGMLLISGNAYVELVETGEGSRELHLLKPDRVRVLTDARGWPTG